MLSYLIAKEAFLQRSSHKVTTRPTESVLEKLVLIA